MKNVGLRAEGVFRQDQGSTGLKKLPWHFCSDRHTSIGRTEGWSLLRDVIGPAHYGKLTNGPLSRLYGPVFGQFKVYEKNKKCIYKDSYI